MANLIRKLQIPFKRNISVKIGVSFLFLCISIEVILFVSLYTVLVNTRVHEEMDALIARGNAHRDVLEKSFDHDTIKHVAVMESESNTAVVIQSADGTILNSSHPLDELMKEHMSEFKSQIDPNGSIIHSDWRRDNYISTVSPIMIDNEVEGYVYMFLDTKNIHEMILRLTTIFLITAVITIFITIISIIFLSRKLTRPLLAIKEGTERIAHGDLSLTLDIKSNDEISGLAASIQQLANDLDFMKTERNEFLAAVAHELRTPLTFIRGYADIASRDTIQEEQRREYLTIIKEETNRITSLVEDLMALAQMEQNKFQIKKEPTFICELINLISAKSIPILSQKNITLRTRCNKDISANIDSVRMEQVLMNLVMNAYKYSANGSIITIQVTTSEQQLHISIQDEGEGIPEQDIPHIFDRFYRVDKSRTRATGGSGLGLAIVQDIVKLHQGSISVTSEVEKGTTFIIDIPLNER